MYVYSPAGMLRGWDNRAEGTGRGAWGGRGAGSCGLPGERPCASFTRSTFFKRRAAHVCGGHNGGPLCACSSCQPCTLTPFTRMCPHTHMHPRTCAHAPVPMHLCPRTCAYTQPPGRAQAHRPHACCLPNDNGAGLRMGLSRPLPPTTWDTSCWCTCCCRSSGARRLLSCAHVPTCKQFQSVVPTIIA